MAARLNRRKTRHPGRKAIPQGLKPSYAAAQYGTAKPVPVVQPV